MSPLISKHKIRLLLGTALLAGSFLILIILLPDYSSISNSENSGSLAAIGTIIGLEASPGREVHSDKYVEIIDSCGINFEGECVQVRSSPTTTATSLSQLRTGVVLRVATSTITDSTGRIWYKIIFDEWVRYPERLKGEWFVAGDFVRVFTAPEKQEIDLGYATTSKHIIIDRSEQMIYAYDGDELYLAEYVSTGLDLTPTPRGNFHVYYKTPTRYMQGPLPGISNQYYDLPGVSWNLYFTEQGGAIHGTYWHDSFGQEWSHGCVNLPVSVAEKLYFWTPLGTEVLVRD